MLLFTVCFSVFVSFFLTVELETFLEKCFFFWFFFSLVFFFFSLFVNDAVIIKHLTGV